MEGSLGGWVGDGVGGWRVHGVGGDGMGGCRVHQVGGGGVHGGVGGWRVHGMGAYTHPPSYNVKTFHFMDTHPPIKHIQSVTLLLYIYSPTHEELRCHNISFYEHPPTHQTYSKCHSVTIHILCMVHGLGGGWLEGSSGGWVGGWWDGWLKV